uniref:Uncharacterized protein n=1 Tax=Candidatus Kentrum sp. FW TaxID=2126338 RepID=A0A450TRU6_9GAMM|nr:MAG: hypothetical protein BECKFW1821C_GA0114237_102532 [Candidatus Kentron sp. FW]
MITRRVHAHDRTTVTDALAALMVGDEDQILAQSAVDRAGAQDTMRLFERGKQETAFPVKGMVVGFVKQHGFHGSKSWPEYFVNRANSSDGCAGESAQFVPKIHEAR